MIAAAFDSTARFVWSRNRKILLACAAGYVAIFIACQVWSPDEVYRSLPQTMVIMRLVPFFLPLLVLVGSANVATARLGSREGYFPRVFYTLPIKAHEMVMPFITYCVALTAALWLAGGILSGWRILMLGPPGTPIEAETISYWLPFLLTSGLVWFQALAWMPVTSGWMRISALMAATLAHFIAVFLCVVGAVTPSAIVVASVLQIPLAFLVAARGVARDRVGVSHDDAGGRAGKAGTNVAKAAARRPLRKFSSAFDAQRWFERQIQRGSGVGISALPILLLVILVVLNLIGRDVKDPELIGIVARIAITMFVWALIALGAVNGFLFGSFRAVTRWQYRDVFAMPSFFATLPTSTGDFVWAKLTTVTTRMLWFSGAAVIACGWIAFSADLIDFDSGRMLALRQQHGDFNASTMLAIPVAAFVLYLLSSTANVMCLSLAGRAWNWANAINVTRYLIFALGAALVAIYWGRHHAAPPGLEWIIDALAILKLVTLTLLVRHVAQRGLQSWGRLAAVLAFWLATFGALLATVLTFVPEAPISALNLVACLTLLTPVQGTIAAPLALHLNRVR